jgi:hypothetical protein
LQGFGGAQEANPKAVPNVEKYFIGRVKQGVWENYPQEEKRCGVI